MNTLTDTMLVMLPWNNNYPCEILTYVRCFPLIWTLCAKTSSYVFLWRQPVHKTQQTFSLCKNFHYNSYGNIASLARSILSSTSSTVWQQDSSTTIIMLTVTDWLNTVKPLHYGHPGNSSNVQTKGGQILHIYIFYTYLPVVSEQIMPLFKEMSSYISVVSS